MSGLSASKSLMMPSHRAWVPSLYDGTSSSMVLESPSSPSSSPNPQPAAARLEGDQRRPRPQQCLVLHDPASPRPPKRSSVIGCAQLLRGSRTSRQYRPRSSWCDARHVKGRRSRFVIVCDWVRVIIDRSAHASDDRFPARAPTEDLAHDRHAPGLPHRGRDRHPATGLARCPGDGRRARGAAAPARRAGRRGGLRDVVLHGADLRRRCARRAGLGITDAWTPTEARLDRGYDRLLAITRSGTTTEVARPAAAARPGLLPATVVTSSPGTPVLDLAAPILTPEVDEQLRGADPVRDDDAGDAALAPGRGPRPGGRAGPGGARRRRGLARPGRRPPTRSPSSGAGWTTGIAQEAALKLRESAQLWTEAYSMMEYRHGPVSISAPGRVVWAFGELVDGFADDIAVTGADLLHAPDRRHGRPAPGAPAVRRPGPRRRAGPRSAAQPDPVDHPLRLTTSGRLLDHGALTPSCSRSTWAVRRSRRPPSIATLTTLAEIEAAEPPRPRHPRRHRRGCRGADRLPSTPTSAPGWPAPAWRCPAWSTATAGAACRSVNLEVTDLDVAGPISARLGIAGTGRPRRGRGRRGRTPLVPATSRTRSSWSSAPAIAAVAFVRGQAVRGVSGQAGEFGHVDRPPRRAALRLRCRAAASRRSPARARSCAPTRSAPGPRSRAPTWSCERRLTDPVAAEIWDDAVSALADALIDVCALLAPGAVLLAGGLAEAGEALTEPLVALMRERSCIAVVPPVALAGLGSRAGLAGAAHLALDLADERRPA